MVGQADLSTCIQASVVSRPSITANTVEGLVKLLRRMMSGGRIVDVGRLESWYFRKTAVTGTQLKQALSRTGVQQRQSSLVLLLGFRKLPDRCMKDV